MIGVLPVIEQQSYPPLGSFKGFSFIISLLELRISTVSRA
jgi:hypothetical protein